MRSKNVEDLIEQEYKRAVALHGPTFTNLSVGVRALRNEVHEVRDALGRGDIDGRHGVVREVAHVVVVGLKILEGLPEWQDEHKAIVPE
jgi:hypothetical protein